METFPYSVRGGEHVRRTVFVGAYEFPYAMPHRLGFVQRGVPYFFPRARYTEHLGNILLEDHESFDDAYRSEERRVGKECLL